eukprot:jgi/Mesvir1/15888/Mv02793-RA.1
MPGLVGKSAANAEEKKVVKKASKKSETPELKKRKKAKVVADEDASVETIAEFGPATKKLKVEKPDGQVEGVVSDAEYRRIHEITVSGLTGSHGIISSFADAPFPKALSNALKNAGFERPSPIQAQAWPIAISGRDLLAIAKTGSGKTCGYLLPAMSRTLEAKEEAPSAGRVVGGKETRSPKVLVMAPTRELAVQIQAEAVKFGRPAGIRSAAVYGGAPKGGQIRDLQAGVEIVVATPGRLLDMLSFKCWDGSEVLRLSDVHTLVLDEADRMLDMGFEKDIMKVVAQLPAKRQTMMFTATWPKAVQRVAAKLLKQPVHVTIGGSAGELSANKDVTQVIHMVDGRDKFDKLTAILGALGDPNARTIVFSNKKRETQKVADALWRAGHKADAIHGDKTQSERESTLGEFKAGTVTILVATDVAARGLDIKGVDLVVNYDFPNCIEDYVHRIGRTGRAGASGVAITLFDEAQDAGSAKELVKIITDAGQQAPTKLRELALHSKSGKSGAARKRWGGGGGWGGGGRGGGGRGGNGRGGSRGNGAGRRSGGRR